MISVDFDPASLSGERRDRYKAWSIEAQAALRQIEAEETPWPERRATVWRVFKEWLSEEFFAFKCAYCEGPLGAQSAGASEHWRPKGGAEKPIGDQIEDETKWTADIDQTTNESHKGYWWLAFAWQNLVPACELCNKKKGTKFPIAGQRVFEPGAVRDFPDLDECEQPLLLHPYVGPDPVGHIGFRVHGEAYAKSGSRLGGATLRVCDLNRWQLRKGRAKAQRDAINAFILACQGILNDRPELDLDEHMADWDGPSANYSRAVIDVLAVPETRLIEALERRRTRRSSN